MSRRKQSGIRASMGLIGNMRGVYSHPSDGPATQATRAALSKDATHTGCFDTDDCPCAKHIEQRRAVRRLAPPSDLCACGMRRDMHTQPGDHLGALGATALGCTAFTALGADGHDGRCECGHPWASHAGAVFGCNAIGCGCRNLGRA